MYRPKTLAAAGLVTALVCASCGDQSADTPSTDSAPNTKSASLAPRTSSSQTQTRLELGRVAPEGTFAWVETRSFRELDGMMKKLEGYFAPEGDHTKNEDFFPDVLQAVGDYRLIERDKPLVVAFSFGVGNPMPVPTYAVPSKKGEEYAATVRKELADATVEVIGGYVVVSRQKGYALSDEAHPITQDLVPGTLRARVDLASVIEAYRPMIEMGLGEARKSVGPATGMLTPDLPLSQTDVDALVEQGFAAVDVLLDSAESLELGVGADGDDLAVDMVFRAAPDSPLGVLSYGRDTGLGEMLSMLDAQSSLVWMLGMDMDALWEQFEPFVKNVAHVYPEDMKAGFLEHMEGFHELAPLFGNSMVGSVDFGRGSTGMAYYFRSPDPEGLTSGLVKLHRPEAAHALGFYADEPKQKKIAGLDATQVGLELNVHALDEITGAEADPEGLEFAMETLYGRDGLRMTVASKDNDVALVFGGNDDYVRTAVRRLEEGFGDPPADLERAVAEVGDASPSFVVRLDFGRMMGQFGEIMVGMMGAPAGTAGPFPTTASAPMTVYGAIDGPVWKAGMTVDMRGMSETQNLLQSGGGF